MPLPLPPPPTLPACPLRSSFWFNVHIWATTDPVLRANHSIGLVGLVGLDEPLNQWGAHGFHKDLGRSQGGGGAYLGCVCEGGGGRHEGLRVCIWGGHGHSCVSVCIHMHPCVCVAIHAYPCVSICSYLCNAFVPNRPVSLPRPGPRHLRILAWPGLMFVAVQSMSRAPCIMCPSLPVVSLLMHLHHVPIPACWPCLPRRGSS